MDIEAQKLLKENFSKLPPELQTALQSSRLPEQIRIVGEKHQLHLDQIGKLKDEVLMFMMGFSEPEDFLSHLVSDVGVSTQTAGEIASDISREIMTPIRDSMKEKGGGAALAQSPAPAVEIHSADLMLSQKTVSAAPPPPLPPTLTSPVAQKPAIPPASVIPTAPVPPPTPPADPSAPKPYKADPYREPLQ